MSEYLKRLREAAMRSSSDHLWKAMKDYKKPIEHREITAKKDEIVGLKQKKKRQF